MSLLVLALVGGAVVGLALGTLGGGGGVLTVPVLTYLLGMPLAAAATTSLVIVSVSSLTALSRHAFAGNIDWPAGLLFAAVGLPLAVGAAVLSSHLPRGLLLTAFAVLAVLAGLAMLRKRQPEGQEPAVSVVATRTRVDRARVAGAGAGLGAVTGLLGVGGGFLVVPTLVTLLSIRMRVAIGTSLLVIAANSVAALATRLVTAPVVLDWATTGPFLGAAVLAAWDGKRLSAKVPEATLRRVFAGLLLCVAAAMVLDVLT
ncbi:sulfite exporter TauE/SafE family protein [Actinokineospora sp. NBRC 105648]|uniref:sulfite exporter TauE/SafE family protein n=1 Tax=Actinokineospora sp. NBRC 105648 TaxID=3032206 RepID=UPI002552B7C3|nr:sulfite exporter TauE/SafE family protein [Actinokineospora sp. NBRC 105648]